MRAKGEFTTQDIEKARGKVIALKRRLKRLAKSDRKKARQIVQEVKDAIAVVPLMEGNRITSKRLRAFASYLRAPVLEFLLAFADGEEPEMNQKPSFPKYGNGESYDIPIENDRTFVVALQNLGMAIWPTGKDPKLSGLGKDVAEWVFDNPGKLSVLIPPGEMRETRDAFTKLQLSKIVRNIKRTLGAIREDGESPKTKVELGIPEDGISYQIFATKAAVSCFARAFGALDGLVVRRQKRPVLDPGKILLV